MKNKWYRVDNTLFIELTRKSGQLSQFAMIDADDFPIVDSFPGTWVIKWNTTAHTFYARNNRFNTWPSGYMHRLIMGVTDHSIPIDHDDHNGLNNRRVNLIPTSVKLNGFNRRGAELGCTSGRRNVYWNKREQKYMVWFVHNGTRYYFGYFTDIEEADVVATRERARWL
jgi:hypothetical protein